ncbi:hypothetical protein [Chengkuizengella axinellae]|uniref:Uncharacterized protein n=1 Tax=Chengkuizengella axinellae TaxID=3064388 RepID=A0ABT9IYX5_9BACL|nr:hypothetical protein [Chengkuizengella sp. 2205SS18-9]MDP5274518.1 hypothetical protein [Chengkuizengella sp. 2205SS18-9]
MENTESLVIFMIVSFALALVLILKKDSISQPFRKYLAIFALFMVLCSFVLLIISFFG